MFYLHPILPANPALTKLVTPLTSGRLPKRFFTVALAMVAIASGLYAVDAEPREKPGRFAEAEPQIPMDPKIKRDAATENEIFGDPTPHEYDAAVEAPPDPKTLTDAGGFSTTYDLPEVKVTDLYGDPKAEAENAMRAAEEELDLYDREFKPYTSFDRNAPRWVYSPLPKVPAGITNPVLSGNPRLEEEQAAATAGEELALEHQALQPLAEDQLHNPSPFLERDFHREEDFLDDADSFNDQVEELNRQLNERWQEFDKNLNNRLGDQEKLVREMQREWRRKRVDAPFYRLPDRELAENTFADDQYLSDRSRLDLRRMDEWDEYHATRNSLRERMVNYNRTSDEYLRLQNNLNDLDQRQAARERAYEREYRNLDVDYSLGRW